MKRIKYRKYKRQKDLVSYAVSNAIKRGNEKLLSIQKEIKELVTQQNIVKLLNKNRGIK
jgi:hypothetical protein